MRISKEDKVMLLAVLFIGIVFIYAYSFVKCSYCWSPNIAKTRVIETKDGVESNIKWCHHHWDFRYDYPEVDDAEDLRFKSGKYIVIQKHTYREE